MAAWVTETLIESELSYDINATTKPSTITTASIIASIQSRCEGALNALKIDISSISETSTPNSFRVVQEWALWGCCARVLAAAGGVIRSQPQKERNYWDMFNSIWHDLKEDPNILGADTPYLTSDDDMVSPDGLVSTDSDYDEPQFTMGMDF